jgi:hypothetical protein
MRCCWPGPTEVAHDCGILGRNTIAGHCVWVSDTEIVLIRETGTQIWHNPSSNAKLRKGVARVPEMLNAGLKAESRLGRGRCNNSRDLFEVMKFASLMHRATRLDASLQQGQRPVSAGAAPAVRIRVRRRARRPAPAARSGWAPRAPPGCPHRYSASISVACTCSCSGYFRTSWHNSGTAAA